MWYQGLNYSATPSGRTGVTDSLGQFNYVAGDTITFTVGGTNSAVVLGEAAGTSTILVEDIADGASGIKTAKIAILLQSLDDDNDADNGINVSGINFDATQSATTKAILDSISESGTHTFTLANIQNFKGATTGVVLVTKASATAHLVETKRNKDNVRIENGKLVSKLTLFDADQSSSIKDIIYDVQNDLVAINETVVAVSVDAAFQDFEIIERY